MLPQRREGNSKRTKLSQRGSWIIDFAAIRTELVSVDETGWPSMSTIVALNLSMKD